MVRCSPRLAKDVDENEEAELRRLEGLPARSFAGALAVRNGDAEMQPAAGGAPCQAKGAEAGGPQDLAALESGSVVVAASERTAKGRTDIVMSASKKQEQLESKKLFRPAAKINGLMPRGGAGLKTTVPRRK